MSELTDFLLERIAEDEAVARAVPPRDKWESLEYGARFSTHDSDHSYEDTLFVSRFDPTRVLAECEAKRTIIERIEDQSDFVYATDWDRTQTDHFLDSLLHMLALPYADHLDYRQEWAV